MVHRTPFFLPLLYPSLIWRIPTDRKELFLTFDDGPVSGPTDFVLETLFKLKAKATFFCIGDNISKYPEVFRKVAAHGHVVANHTFNHLNGWQTNTDSYVENTWKCNQEIHAHLLGEVTQSMSTDLFRPPYGRITRSQISALSDYKIIMWDVLSVDYNAHLSSERCLRNTIGATRNGSVIVFHDSFKAEKNLMYALPRFLEHFASQGFEFNVISG